MSSLNSPARAASENLLGFFVNGMSTNGLHWSLQTCVKTHGGEKTNKCNQCENVFIQTVLFQSVSGLRIF